MSDEKTERWVAKLEDRIARDGIDIETTDGQRVAYVRPDDTMEIDGGMIVECCSETQKLRARIITSAPDMRDALEHVFAAFDLDDISQLTRDQQRALEAVDVVLRRIARGGK